MLPNAIWLYLIFVKNVAFGPRWGYKKLAKKMMMI